MHRRGGDILSHTKKTNPYIHRTKPRQSSICRNGREGFSKNIQKLLQARKISNTCTWRAHACDVAKVLCRNRPFYIYLVYLILKDERVLSSFVSHSCCVLLYLLSNIAQSHKATGLPRYSSCQGIKFRRSSGGKSTVLVCCVDRFRCRIAFSLL